ncbi:hypothetical protein ZYGR_0AL00430 [Zygosaccharomyces rouxii]|uniref:Major facilitator superfamily (MFS) profile domain-containing protein n=1 Tax=Zygosaccharomyces rouxii TaxID=4956 RepID=A0A1Q3AF66_ZYGRO|nr:hypothetical protein ZYGR_0AL00430 [Zygosaccharomyces rouxii]
MAASSISERDITPDHRQKMADLEKGSPVESGSDSGYHDSTTPRQEDEIEKQGYDGETPPDSDSPVVRGSGAESLPRGVPEGVPEDQLGFEPPRGIKAYMLSRTAHAGVRGRKLRVLCSLTAVIAFLLFGYDQGLMSGVISGDEFNNEFPATKEKSTHQRTTVVIQGAVTACYELGCFVGSIFVMFMGERIGRKPCIIMGALISIAGATISTVAFHHAWGLGQFVVGRVVTGVGTGLNTSSIPVWQSEMAKPNVRGRLINLDGSTIALGTMIAYWLDLGFSFIKNSVQWRFPVSLQVLFALILFVGIIQMPESPRWLIGQKRVQEAKYILAALNDCSMDDDAIVAEVTMLMDTARRFENKKRSIKDLLTNGKTQNMNRAIIAASTQFMQQFTGCNAAIYYATILFQQTLKRSRTVSLIVGGAFSTVYFFSTIPTFYLVENLGRRPMFLIGVIGQCLSFVITFACLINPTPENGKGAAVGLFLFIIFFGLAMLPLPWIYPPEVASMRVRAATNALSTMCNWLTNFAVVMFTPVFIQTSQWGTYFFFFLMNLIYIPVVFLFYPETAGRSLEEIDVIFAKAHVEHAQPWRVAAKLPKLSMTEVEDYSSALGLYDDENEKEGIEGGEGDEEPQENALFTAEPLNDSTSSRESERAPHA